MNLVNGVACDAIGVRDRGLAYGDGVFRTFPLRGGKPLLWRRQHAKLAHDCRALNIDCPPPAAFASDLALIAASAPDCVVKIIVTRGVSARGYALPERQTPTRIVASSALPEHPLQYREQGVRAHFCRLRLAPQPALAGVKHLNRLENVLARAEWSDPGIAEGVLCDADGNVIGGTMSNIFLVRDKSLSTPELSRCGVSGVMRELVIELAAAHAVPVRVAAIGIDELFAADEVFIVNSVIGAWPLCALDRKRWQAGELGTRVQQWISDAQSN
jgi:4-amino-4-deoxychorismate lyase